MTPVTATRTADTAPVGARLPFAVKLGLLGIAFPVVGGRWGSYIGVQPIFLSDVLLIVGAVITFVLPRKYPPAARFPRAYWLCWSATGCFLLVSILLGEGELVTRIRDLIPWFYLLLVPAVTEWVLVAGRQRLLNYLTVVLTAHASWAIPAMLGILPSIQLPLRFVGIPVFSVRADIDVPLLAAAVLVVLYRYGARPGWIVFALCAGGAALAQTSRAALVGSVLALLLVMWFRGGLRGARGFVRAAACVVVAGMVVLIVLPASTGGEGDRFGSGALARAGLYGSASVEAGGTGTARARFDAWGILLERYAAEGCPPLGLGAGAEIVWNSGAVADLSGAADVRAPHNWWVHALVRTGYVGLLLWCALVMTASRWRPSPPRQERMSFLPALGVFLVTSVVLTGSLGVVIEAPFGSQVLILGIALLGSRTRISDGFFSAPRDARPRRRISARR